MSYHRVKILVVIERLLDRAIMSANDQMFKRLVRWLQLIETELDPYKSPQSAKILSDLRKQVCMRVCRYINAPICVNHFSYRCTSII
jgi:hypothetical protein